MTTDAEKDENAWGVAARAQKPTISVTFAALIVLAALYASGYLTPDRNLLALQEFEQAFRGSGATPFDATTVAAHRGALAVSGILFAATVALSITAVIWAVSNISKYFVKFDSPKAILLMTSVASTTLCAKLIFVAIGVGIDKLNASLALISVPASRLLDMTAVELPDAMWLAAVPELMFMQAFVLPMVFAFGVSFRLLPPDAADSPRDGPMDPWREWVAGSTGKQAEARRRIGDLTARVRELDQVLYIGALALVFGTLQLSAALSVPLAVMPAAADVRTTIDLCKAGPAAAGNPFLPAPASSTAESIVSRKQTPGETGPKATAKASPAPAASKPAVATQAVSSASQTRVKAAAGTVRAGFHRAFKLDDCLGVATEWARVNVAQSVRSMIHALTISFGLAFSLLLGAIYLPAILRLRQWIDESRALLADQTDADLGDADPVRRIVAVVATLSPAIAALVANTLSAG